MMEADRFENCVLAAPMSLAPLILAVAWESSDLIFSHLALSLPVPAAELTFANACARSWVAAVGI